MTADGEPVSGVDPEPAGAPAPGLLDDPAAAKRYLMWSAVALLALLATVATFQVYTNVSTAIARFVAVDYRPLFQAGFNLVVLLLAVAGISTLLGRLQAAS